jgi:phosphatidate phosphatase PAH1
VAVWIDDCAGWRALGEHLTDSDGRIAVDVPADVVTTPGVYEARFQVLGDRSLTTAYVWLLPRGTHVVVTDIDGTMTTSDSQLFQQILDGSHVPVPYPGAVDLTTGHAGRGQVVVFLTGRPYYLTQRSRDWLRDLAFAPGPLHGTDSNTEAVPSQAGVGDFKKHFLMGLVAAGYDIDVAYGNATTDIYAYLGAGIPAARIWIIGSNGGMQGTHAVSDTWAPRVTEVRGGPVVLQPFDW